MTAVTGAAKSACSVMAYAVCASFQNPTATKNPSTLSAIAKTAGVIIRAQPITGAEELGFPSVLTLSDSLLRF